MPTNVKEFPRLDFTSAQANLEANIKIRSWQNTVQLQHGQ